VVKGSAPGVVAVACLTVAGCWGGSQPHEDRSVSSSVGVSTPSPSIDPQAQPAVNAYLGFSRAAFNADRHPLPAGSAYPAAADFTQYTWDPLRAQVTAQLVASNRFGIAYRGTPPAPRITSVELRLNSHPYPSVVLTNCDTPAPTWEAFDPATGQRLSTTGASVPPPYQTTITVILYQGRWGVQSISADTSRTCTA
jgi:hypothetical protein